MFFFFLFSFPPFDCCFLFVFILWTWRRFVRIYLFFVWL